VDIRQEFSPIGEEDLERLAEDPEKYCGKTIVIRGRIHRRQPLIMHTLHLAISIVIVLDRSPVNRRRGLGTLRESL